MIAFWNNRYSVKDFAYGEEPNVFFKQELDKLSKGKILLPADGEGRNSVYAAKSEWQSYACDLSEEGKNKAEKLADKNQLTIEYQVGDFGKLEYENKSLDAIALIFAHFPPNKKTEYHQLINRYLKVGGYIILEAFGKKHLQYHSTNPTVGGPKDFDMLYSLKELETDFDNYEIITLEEVEVGLSEGLFHKGKGSVVRFAARKMR